LVHRRGFPRWVMMTVGAGGTRRRRTDNVGARLLTMATITNYHRVTALRTNRQEDGPCRDSRRDVLLFPKRR
jgi:hypothetical protein